MELQRTLLPNKIRKLIICGLTKEEKMYIVDKEFTVAATNERIRVTKIERDEDAYYLYGDIMYVIYASVNGGKEFIWQVSQGNPVIIEYSK